MTRDFFFSLSLCQKGVKKQESIIVLKKQESMLAKSKKYF
tara:strand:+ start:160 stop:279 length:120 start_codon:yes stop_codon:yes gene_type:complete